MGLAKNGAKFCGKVLVGGDEIACEQAPKRSIGRKEKSASSQRSIFVFALYPTWEPVHRLLTKMLMGLLKSYFKLGAES